MPKTKKRDHKVRTRTKSPGSRTLGGQKKFPPEVKMVNMIYATHIPKRERKRALRDVYAVEPVAPKFNPWSSFPITFDRRDHPTSIRHGGSAALVLDPIIDGFHLTRVLMDGGTASTCSIKTQFGTWALTPQGSNPQKQPSRASFQA